MELSEQVRQVIESNALAHYATINPDGSPQVSVVWVGVDGDEIVAGHLFDQQKLRNIRRDPRVVISLATGATHTNGLAEYLILHGNARITEGGAAELLQRLAHTYLGPDVRFPPMDGPPPGFVTHVTVAKVGGAGPWSG
ncbi:MAG: hypothetical protein QOJ09_1485 [Actinomycetota bacterium]|jgi:PPOX class probable F420-dependent enzyme|nr:hypothetical protein [Actinomycetota bacterium]